MIVYGNKLMMSLNDWWYSSFSQEETEEARAIRTVINHIEKNLVQFKIEKPEYYSKDEFDALKGAISIRLLSLRSAQRWKYDEETAKEVAFLERLYKKLEDGALKCV